MYMLLEPSGRKPANAIGPNVTEMTQQSHESHLEMSGINAFSQLIDQD